jgi:SPP1 family predicted phage head-tail adaptor
MRAGTMRDRVTIQRQSTSSTPQWGKSTNWTDVATVWASVVPTNAVESFQQKGTASGTNYTVKLRYRADLTSADRLMYRGKVLDLVSVVDVGGRHRELECQAVHHG